MYARNLSDAIDDTRGCIRAHFMLLLWDRGMPFLLTLAHSADGPGPFSFTRLRYFPPPWKAFPAGAASICISARVAARSPTVHRVHQPPTAGPNGFWSYLEGFPAIAPALIPLRPELHELSVFPFLISPLSFSWPSLLVSPAIFPTEKYEITPPFRVCSR